MSFIGEAFTFQHNSPTILARFPYRLNASELSAIAELEAAGFIARPATYRSWKQRLAVRIAQREDNRRCVGDRTHRRVERYELARLTYVEAAAKRQEKKATRDQRPKFVASSEREESKAALEATPEPTDAELEAVGV